MWSRKKSSSKVSLSHFLGIFSRTAKSKMTANFDFISSSTTALLDSELPIYNEGVYVLTMLIYREGIYRLCEHGIWGSQVRSLLGFLSHFLSLRISKEHQFQSFISYSRTPLLSPDSYIVYCSTIGVCCYGTKRESPPSV